MKFLNLLTLLKIISMFLAIQAFIQHLSFSQQYFLFFITEPTNKFESDFLEIVQHNIPNCNSSKNENSPKNCIPNRKEIFSIHTKILH